MSRLSLSFFLFSSGRSSRQRSSGLRRRVCDGRLWSSSILSCPLFCSAGSSSRTFLELDYFHGTFWTGRFPLHSPCFLTMSGLSLSFFSSLPAARLVREKVRPETASLRCFSPWSILRLSRVLSSLLFRRVVCHYVYGARLFSWHFLNVSLSPPLSLFFDNVWSLPVFFFLLFQPLVLSEIVRPETASSRCFCPWSIFRLSRVVSSLLFRRVVFQYVSGARLFSWHFLDWSLSPPFPLFFDNVSSLPVFFSLLFRPLVSSEIVRPETASLRRTFMELEYFPGAFWTGRFPLHVPCFLTPFGLSLSFFSFFRPLVLSERRSGLSGHDKSAWC